jgi:esterase/lipase
MRQIKFTVEEEIVGAFKDKCASEGISMTSVIKSWMSGRQPTGQHKVKTQTSPQRKKAVAEILDKLSEVLEEHERYRDSIPEQFTQRYETADEFCGRVSEAIDILEESL